MSASSDFADRFARMVNNRTVASQLRAALGAAAPSVSVEQTSAGWPFDVAIERAGSGYRVIYPQGSRQRFFLASSTYLAAYLFWFNACPPEVRRMTVTASDGDQPSQSRFSPSTPSPAQIAIPDPYFFRARGFAAERQVAAGAADWSGRSDEIVWRGTPNGFGRMGFGAEATKDQTVNARLRMVLLLADQAGCDVRFSGLLEELARWEAPFRQMGYLAPPQPQESWLGRKYAIDIDGHANTWSNFLVRMLFGCCVFKVDSQFGFRQWYYDRLKPFEHFIPIRADMSDILEKMEWATSHQREAQEIAEAGQRFAMKLDFEAGKRDAIEIIGMNWDRQI